MPQKSTDTAGAAGLEKFVFTNLSADKGQAGSICDRRRSGRGKREWWGVGQTELLVVV